MQVVQSLGGFQINLSADELRILGSCLNEALELVDESEFQTRVGAKRATVVELLRKLRDGYRQRQLK